MRTDEHPFQSTDEPIHNLPEITGLPIWPVLKEVNLLDRDQNPIGTGIRWTLGPTWYDIHEHSSELADEFVPYFDKPEFTADEPDSEPYEVPERVKKWAEWMIGRTTDFRVVEWRGAIPDLELVHAVLRIRTTDGITDSYVVDRAGVYFMLGHLSDPNYVLTFPCPDPLEQSICIPVRAITSVRRVTLRVKVENS